MKNVTITIFLLFVLTSCFDKNKPIDDNQVIQNCIKEIVNPDPKSIDSTYMINPYCNSFTFNNYTINNYENKYITLKNKKNVLKKIGLNDEDFQKRKKKIDKEYLNKYFSNLENLSKGNRSHKLITFSGISENLVFVEIITFCDAINKSDLKKQNLYYSKNIIKDISSLAIILENKKVKEVTVDNGIVFEKQCNVTK
jgi:hypothetical protein